MATKEELFPLIRSLQELHQAMTASTSQSPHLEGIEERRLPSAKNLLQYLFFRNQDLRILQDQLMERGFSSLGRSEAHILYSLQRVLNSIGELCGEIHDLPELGQVPDFQTGRSLLDQNTQVVWGPAPPGRSVRIMVTMPSEAADDPFLIQDLLNGGMDCMRINCAHDSPAVWSRMISRLREARTETGLPCTVLMDLAGPKLRTGRIQEGPRVVRWKPVRNAFGRVISPARVWLYPEGTTPTPPGPRDCPVPVAASWLEGLWEGDKVDFTDSRDSERSLKIMSKTVDGVLAECDETAYLVPGTRFERRSGQDPEEGDWTKVGELPARESFILLKQGDLLRLTRDQAPGRPARRDASGKIVEPACVPCTLPEIFNYIQPEERVFLDDGKIGARILSVDKGEGALLEITHAHPDGDKLKPEKGINLPDSRLSIPALSEKDVADLDFVAKNSDLVSLSFAQKPGDVRDLQKRLLDLGRPDMGIVLKVETKQGFENLPSMLLQLMRWSRGAVMIARGDLAVECGYERLAEVQEEILWICEAAHVPAIWATQVLETLAKTGRPSRSEITDAAMGERAECVMLNKGPHIREALRTLDDILRRMQAHQRKKSQMLRRLHSWNMSLTS